MKEGSRRQAAKMQNNFGLNFQKSKTRQDNEKVRQKSAIL